LPTSTGSKVSPPFARHSNDVAAWCRPIISKSGERPGRASSPTAIALANRGLAALAGLWETSRSPAGKRMQLRGHHDDAERLYAKRHTLCR
jgi:hypothetical protein